MHIISIINIFLLPALISILVIGALLNLKYTKKNVYQGYLVSMLSFWALVMTLIYIKFFKDGAITISYTTDVMSMQVILLGIPCFFSIVSYPMVIIDANFRTLKRWAYMSIPILTILLIYFGYHAITGRNPMVVYHSYSELLENIYTPTVILRVLLALTFILYVATYIGAIWRAVPIYNRYIHENIADSDYDVDWIRTLMVYISITSIIYFLMMFNSSPLINMCYLISLILNFFFIVEMSIIYKVSEAVEPLSLSHYKGREYLYSVYKKRREEGAGEESDPNSSSDTLEDIALRIDRWMDNSSTYTRIDFTTDDIIDQFPSLTAYDLTTLFKSRGETFRAYVRRYRICRACEIIESDGEKVNFKQIFDEVGFSHYSSFSRSFVAATGYSPTEYAKHSKGEKAAIIAKLKIGSTN